MLNKLLQLDQPLFVIDVESTSLDIRQARIIEIAFQRWDSTGMTKEWSSRINPGVPIPLESTRVHGIKDADVAARPRFEQIAANLAKGFSDCSFAGQNCRYDLQVISAEMKRANVTWSYTKARIIDSFQLERLAVPRNLGALHEKYVGYPHDGAHGALSDVRAAATVIAKQLEKYPNLPRDIEKLHREQWPDEWLDGEGKFKIINGVACITFGKHRGLAMDKIPRDYYEKFILTSDFSNEVKQLATDALAGVFPTMAPKGEQR